MNRLIAITAAATALASAVLLAGPLDPPQGPIAPTMKPLDQVEPRIAVGPQTTPGDDDNTPSLYKITQPGSYYLVGNITGVSGKSGVEIASSGVTLDLMGFELIGVPGSIDGLIVSVPYTTYNVTIKNGAARDWGRIGFNNYGGRCSRMENLTAANNTGIGINASYESQVVNCVADANGEHGIQVNGLSNVSRCTSTYNGQRGFSLGGSVSVDGCTAVGNDDVFYGSGNASSCASSHSGGAGFVGSAAVFTGCAASDNHGAGIDAGAGSVVTACSVSSSDGVGIAVGNSGLVTDCTVFYNKGGGIDAPVRTTIRDCTVRSNGPFGIKVGTECEVRGCSASLHTAEFGLGAGILSSGAGNRIEDNQATSNDTGFRIQGNNSVIVKNSARGNTTNYSIAAGNEQAEIIVNPGMNFTVSNPWANFAY